MSIFGIITILVIIAFIIGLGVYFGWEYKEDLKDIKDIQIHRKAKEALLIDIHRVGMGTLHDPTHQYFRQTKSWIRCHTDEDKEKIYRLGYMEAEKWLDDLRYVGIKTYVRIHGFTAPPEPNKITSSVLYNVYSSRSVSKFVNGITKINLSTMDVKTIGVLIPIVIGIALGMLYFMGGF